jgi:hypothetical protein
MVILDRSVNGLPREIIFFAGNLNPKDLQAPFDAEALEIGRLAWSAAR